MDRVVNWWTGPCNWNEDWCESPIDSCDPAGKFLLCWEHRLVICKMNITFSAIFPNELALEWAWHAD